ncbi:MAG: flagellar type III secretion system pore protein FliP [Rhodobacteraceae bacterium]|nr:flagellar type III secretion system pore protein FliP [Paracoccaceae bacterium]
MKAGSKFPERLKTSVKHVLAGMGLAMIALPAVGQELNLTVSGQTLSGQSFLLIALVTVLSLAPGLAVMITCFPFIVTVLSILRQAIGLQQSPPNMLIVSLSLFLTWFIMEPVFQAAWADGISPLIAGTIDLSTAFDRGISPFRMFMSQRVDIATFASLADLRPETAGITDTASAPLSLLVPSFMLSEIARAFEIGFLIFLPFLIIDLVVSAVLMSMGMMMVPPAVVALPFKLAFFVVANGWSLISGALVRSYF